MPRYDYDGWLDGMAQKRPLLRRSMAEGSRHLCIASPAVESLYLPLYKSPISECASILSCVRSTMVRWLFVVLCDLSEAGFCSEDLAGGECQQAGRQKLLDVDGRTRVCVWVGVWFATRVLCQHELLRIQE